MTYAIGCDISKWQDKPDTPEDVNFDTMRLAGIDFVFLKASQSTWTDRVFVEYWPAAKAAGLLRGAYHFLDYKIDPRLQAEYFWSLIKDDPGELPMVADYEWWGTPPREAGNFLWGFVDTLQRLSGKTPMIYTGAFFWNTYSSTTWAKFPLWIASYSDQTYMEKNIATRMPWDNWTFWQYTDKGPGKKYGVESEQIDMNYYNGTTEELLARYAIGAPLPPVQPEYTETEKVDKLWAAHEELWR